MKKCLLSVLAVVLISLQSTAQSPVLYGMTQNGGANNVGTIFMYDVNASRETVLHSFGTGTDGSLPTGSLLLCSNGLLYGLTTTGGANGKGMLFSYNIGTRAYTDVHDFGYGTDAQTPHGSLIEATNGLLYGISESGGVNSGGTIFTYNRYTDSTTVVYNLGALYDAQLPFGSLFQTYDSLLYGLSLRGGGAGGAGALFDFNTIENTDTVLYSFGANDTDSQNPYGGLVQASNGLLYGTSFYGGKYNAGSIFGFYYSDSTYTDTLLYSFGTGTDGQNPHGSFTVGANNTLYATTLNGGSSDSGTIISFNFSTKTESVLHSFAGGSDGSSPYGSLFMASNQLYYGMTANGGANSLGTIFSFNISGNEEIPIYSFSGGADGAIPMGDLVEVDGIPAVTGILPDKIEDKLAIFPNPSSGQFTVSLPATQNAYPVDVFDMMGNKVYQAVLSNTQNTINLNTQPAGMYFVYTTTNTGVIAGKVMVVK